MKKLLSLILALVTLYSLFFTVNVSAAAWPGLGIYSYCEITAPKTINVYTSMYLNKRGTSSPSKQYNAYIDKGDICKIYRIESNFIHLAYPTSSGYKQGFIKRSDMFGVSSPSETFTSNGKATTYKYAGSSSYGNTAKGDAIYKVGTSGSYTQIIYTAKSGSRAFKAGWVKNSQYEKIARIEESSEKPSYEQKPNNSGSTSIADVAETQIGYQGTKSNGTGKGDYTKYGILTNTNGMAWCASFVSWCAKEAGISTSLIPCNADCDYMKNNSSNYRRWTSSSINKIKKNDIVFLQMECREQTVTMWESLQRSTATKLL